MNGISLVDYLAYKLDLTYISDLRFDIDLSREKLKYLLETRISLEDFSERDWLDACEYIAGEKRNSKEEAREHLFRYLSEDVKEHGKGGKYEKRI